MAKPLLPDPSRCPTTSGAAGYHGDPTRYADVWSRAFDREVSRVHATSPAAAADAASGPAASAGTAMAVAARAYYDRPGASCGPSGEPTSTISSAGRFRRRAASRMASALGAS